MKCLVPASEQFQQKVVHGAIELAIAASSVSGRVVATVEIKVLDQDASRTLDIVSFSNPATYRANHRVKGFGVSVLDDGYKVEIEICASRRASKDFNVPREVVHFMFELQPGATSGHYQLNGMRAQEKLFSVFLAPPREIDVVP